MKKIGLTGNAGSGKSTVRKLFEERGIPCLDADLVAHEIYQRRPDVVALLQEEFGDDVVREGKLVRPLLADRAFSSPEKTQILNSIVHPVIGEEIQTWFRDREDLGFQLAVVEATLIIESGRQDGYDEIWLIQVDPDIQNQRLMDRGWSQKEITARLSKQMPQAQKSKFAHVCIDNSFDKMSLTREFLKNLA